MKCPLLGLDWEGRPWAEKSTQRDCLEKECAWWLTIDKACAIVGIRHGLANLVECSREIEAKTPNQYQYRSKEA